MLNVYSSLLITSKTFFYLIFFSILEEQLRLSLITSVKEIYEKSGLKGIVKERVKKLENEINSLMEDPLAKYLDVRIINLLKII
jgi:hypothetical protein